MLKQSHLLAAVVLIFVSCSAITLTADVIYDNEVDPNAAYWNDPLSVAQWVADDFVLQAGSNTIGKVEWTGVYGEFVSNDSFTFEFFREQNTGPELVPFLVINPVSVQRVFTGNQVLGLDLYAYSSVIAPTSFNPGDRFWVSILNHTNGAFWNWTTDNTRGEIFFRSDLGDPWTPFQSEMDFRFLGVPEPSSTALLGVCLLGGWMRRKSHE